MGTHAEELKRKSFEEAARPLIAWLNENVHPEHGVFVTQTSAELMESNMRIICREYVKG